MASRIFSQLDDIDYTFNQMEALPSTIDDIEFLGNYYERISLLGKSESIVNPKLIIHLLNTLIGTGTVTAFIKMPPSGRITSIEGIYSLIQYILGDAQLLESVYGNKDVVSYMGGEENLISAINGMKDYVSTFRGEFKLLE